MLKSLLPLLPWVEWMLERLLIGSYSFKGFLCYLSIGSVFTAQEFKNGCPLMWCNTLGQPTCLPENSCNCCQPWDSSWFVLSCVIVTSALRDLCLFSLPGKAEASATVSPVPTVAVLRYAYRQSYDLSFPGPGSESEREDRSLKP